MPFSSEFFTFDFLILAWPKLLWFKSRLLLKSYVFAKIMTLVALFDGFIKDAVSIAWT